MPKFLIIRFSSIGDIVLTTPVIRCLKQQVKDAEVHYLTKPAFAAILQPNPYIGKLHLLADNFSETVAALNKEGFDFVIDLHHNLRTFRVKTALGKPGYSFDKLNFEKWLLTTLKINKLPRVHIVDRYLATLKAFGVTNDGLGLDYFLKSNDHVAPDQLPETHRRGFAALVLGATYATKQLPFEKLDELCGLLRHPVVLLGGPAEQATGEMLARNHNLAFNACGKFTLNQSASLVQQCRLVITHDTGLMHIAAAFQKPIISIWGNTVPEFGMGPYYAAKNGDRSVVHEVNGLGCRPCSKIGYRKCPKGHFKCMMLQDLDRVRLTADRFWEG